MALPVSSARRCRSASSRSSPSSLLTNILPSSLSAAIVSPSSQNSCERMNRSVLGESRPASSDSSSASANNQPFSAAIFCDHRTASRLRVVSSVSIDSRCATADAGYSYILVTPLGALDGVGVVQALMPRAIKPARTHLCSSGNKLTSWAMDLAVVREGMAMVPDCTERMKN